DHQMFLVLQSPRDCHRHLLLLRPIFEVLRLREQAVLGKERAHPLDKVAAKRIFQCNHSRSVSRAFVIPSEVEESRSTRRCLDFARHDMAAGAGETVNAKLYSSCDCSTYTSFAMFCRPTSTALRRLF